MAIFVNDGTVSAIAFGAAVGISTGIVQPASASGIQQTAVANGTAVASIVNNGIVVASGSAQANGNLAIADASATGFQQLAAAATITTAGGTDFFVSGSLVASGVASAVVANVGLLDVDANALANGGSAFATATATGIRQTASAGDDGLAIRKRAQFGDH